MKKLLIFAAFLLIFISLIAAMALASDADSGTLWAKTLSGPPTAEVLTEPIFVCINSISAKEKAASIIVKVPENADTEIQYNLQTENQSCGGVARGKIRVFEKDNWVLMATLDGAPHYWQLVSSDKKLKPRPRQPIFDGRENFFFVWLIESTIGRIFLAAFIIMIGIGILLFWPRRR